MLALVLVLFLILLLLGFPLLAAMGIPALLYTIVEGMPISTMAYSIFQSLNSFPLIASPLFILMGSLINEFDETKNLFNFCRVLLRNAKGYSAKVNILASLVFAGMSGAAVADIGGLGPIEIKAMRDEGFSVPYAAALTGATSVVGPIFPPSIPLVIYAVLSETSSIRCLMAGAIPSVLITVIMFLFVSVQTRKKLPAKAIELSTRTKESLLSVTIKALPILILVPGIIFSMLSGIFSPSEAGGAAVLYVIIMQVLKHKFSFKILFRAIVSTYKSIGTIFVVIAIASFFTKVLTIERFPEMVASAFISLADYPWLVLLMINVLLLVVGMFMETISALTVLTPILLSVGATIGLDPIHLGVIIVFNLTIGMLTPPFGVGLYTVATIGQVEPTRVLKELLPLYIPLFVALIFITFVPFLTTWLPNLL